MSEQQRSLLQRLSWVQSKVDYIQKEKKPGMRYSIVSHDAVTAKVRPFMVEAGVFYYPVWMDQQQTGNRTEMKLTVRFVSIDDANDYIDVVSAGYGIDDQDKGPGKAISYAVKYALLKCLGLETGDDPDHDQDAVHNPEAYVPAKGGGYKNAKGFTDGQMNAAGKRRTIDELTNDMQDVHTELAYTKLRDYWAPIIDKWRDSDDEVEVSWKGLAIALFKAKREELNGTAERSTLEAM